jgi:hypothetical protein
MVRSSAGSTGGRANSGTGTAAPLLGADHHATVYTGTPPIPTLRNVALGPSAGSLPPFIEDQRAREWKARHEFFDRVAHHGDCSEEEFDASADVVERLMLDYLRPRTFDDFAAIDAIIEEGEKDA